MHDPASHFRRLVDRGENVLLTGMAGTGKSTLLREYLDECGDDDEIAVTASTGIAALNIGGSTVHRWSGMMLGPRRGEDPKEYLRLLMADNRRSVRAGFDRIRACRVLVLDEVSMLPGTTLSFLDLLCQKVRRDESPFGGIQVIATGDALQLPPVRTNPADTYDWFFHTTTWLLADFKTVHLTKVHRQDEPEFLAALGEFRRGQLSSASAALLASRVSHFPDADIPRLFTHNAQVDRWNAYRLACIEAEESVFTARTTGPQHQVDFLIKNLLTPQRLVLKPGARVMFTVNRPDGGFVNGQCGTVVECRPAPEGMEDLSRVQVETEGRVIAVDPFEWRFDSRDKHSATFRQIPLRLAWSSTIHKCVSVSARVPTQRGIVRASDVAPEDVVHTGSDGYARCLAVSRQGCRDVVRVHTHLGFSLTCTPDHPLLAVCEGWKEPAFAEAGSLGTRDHVCLSTAALGIEREPLQIELTYSSREKPLRVSCLDEPLAYLLGSLTANGSYRSGDTIFFSNLDNEALAAVRDTVTALGIRVRDKETTSKCRSVYFASAPFFRMMAQLGMTRQIACRKAVPDAVWHSSDRVRAAYLRGLFDGDGSASGNSAVRLVTTSPQLACEVQQLLLGLGIVSYLHRDFYKAEQHHSYSLTVHISGNQLNGFRRQVGFTVSVKARALDQMILKHGGKTSVDFIPHGEHIKQAVRSAFASKPSRGRKGCAVTACRSRRISSILSAYKNLSRRHLAILRDALVHQGLDVPEILAQELKRPLFYDRVAWVEPMGTEEVIDLEIETAHRFQADGFVCHNCQGLTLDSAFIDIRAAREPGQAYVAVSRVRSLAGLHLKAWFSGIYVSTEALEFYERIGCSPLTPQLQTQAA